MGRVETAIERDVAHDTLFWTSDSREYIYPNILLCHSDA